MNTNPNSNKIIEEYLSGTSNKDLSKKYSLHRTSIQRLLKKNEIKLRKQEETRKHTIDFNYFKKIDTEFKAYFLGLVYADGNLSRNCIDISLIDKQILEDISKKIYGKIILSERNAKQVTINKKNYNQKKQYRFLITCKEIVKDLKQHGLSENKTFKIRFPNINKELLRHFIRGYMDGDGCIFVDKKHNHQVKIISNKKFCDDLKNIIDKMFNITSSVILRKNKVFSFEIYGRQQILFFLDWLYFESTISLERKFKKYIKLKELS